MDVPTEEAALEWLRRMKHFCTQLQEFLLEYVADDSELKDFTNIPECIAKDSNFAEMYLVCTDQVAGSYMQGMPGIKSERVKREAQTLHRMALRT
jgi:hypothetical protein